MGIERRLLQWHFSSRGQALLALIATWTAFFVTSWLLFEVADQTHRFDASFVAHLRAAPEELLVQSLVGPFMMHLGIPAVFHRGSLFDWDPGWLAGTGAFAIYWALLGSIHVAVLGSRRGVWCLLLAALLLGTALRLGELVYVALLVT